MKLSDMYGLSNKSTALQACYLVSSRTDRPEAVALDEVLELDDLYAAAFDHDTATQHTISSLEDSR